MTKRRTAREWSEILERWQRSGQSAKEFAEAEGVVAATLSWWRTHLRGKRRASRDKAAPAAADTSRKPAAEQRIAVDDAPQTAARGSASKKLVPKKKVTKRSTTKRSTTKKHRAGSRTQRESADSGAPIQMVELVAADVSTPRETAIELALGGDVTVRVRRGFDAETLRRLLAVCAGEDNISC